MAHQFRMLLCRVPRGSPRDVLLVLVLVLAATALPEWTVQSAEPQAEQRRPISYRNDVVPLLTSSLAFSSG